MTSSGALRDLLSDRNSNYLFGLSKYFYYNNVQPSYQYQCVRNTNLNTITAAFLGSTLRIKPMIYFSQPFMQYGFAAFPLYGCSDPVYNYNSTSHLCQSAIDCIKGYFYNASSQVCELCRRNCIDCTESLCLQCGLKRKIVDNACAVEKGYYETNISTVESCDASCLSCQESPTKCSFCAQDYFLRDQACITCPQLITNCRACSLSTCLACDHGYFLINSTFCGLPCIDFECLVCDHPDRTYCHKCRKASYLLVDGICEPEKQKPVIFGCGDSIINIGQECDDGKNINRDGCSSYCTVEDDYSCETYIDNFANNRTKYCAYLHEIDFEPVSVEKLDFSNSIRITVAVKQYREVFWDTQITLNINVVQQPIPYRNMKVSFVKRSSPANGNSKAAVQSVNDPFPQSSLLYITFDYFKSMHGQDVNLSFYFGESLDLRVKQIPKKTVTLTILPDNNHYAHLYPAEIYSYQRQLNSFFSFLVIASLTLFILTLIFGSKRISVEMIVVLQIAFLSLVTIPKITPLFSSLSSLSHSGSGFNLLYSEDVRPFHDSDTNDRIKGTRLYSQFIYNVNLSLAFVFLPLLIGFVTLFVGKVINFSRKHADNVESAYKRLLAEYPFAGLVFVGCSVGAASVLQIHFGLQNASTLGLAVMALSLFMFILYGVLRCKCSQHFGEFNEMLIEDSSFALLFQTVYFYLGVSVAVLYFQFYSFVFINFAVAAFVVLLYVLTLVKPIFRKNIDKYRTQLKLLSVLLLQIPGMYMNMRINAGFLYKSKEDMSLLLPLLTMSVISLNFMVNSIYIFYEWYKSLQKCFITAIKQSGVKQILMNQDKLYLSNQYKQLIKNSLSKPLNLQQMKCVDHKKRRFRQNFIQDQEQQSTTFKQMLNQRKELQNFVLAGIKRSLRKDTQIREDNTLQNDRSNKIKVI